MRRILLYFLRLCLCMMLAVILHEFLAEGIGLGERPALMDFLPLLACYGAGCVFPGKKRGWLLLLPACAGSVCLQALISGVPPALSVKAGLLVMDAVLLFLLGWSRKEAWPSALGLPAAGFSLLTCGILSWRGRSAAFPGLCAVLVIVIWLLDMHREGMETGLHNAPGETPMPYPRGLRWKNWLLIILFLGLSLGLAAVPFLQDGADWLWESAVSGTKDLTSDMAAKLREKIDQPPAETPSPTPSPSPSPTPEPEPEEDLPEEGIPPVLRYGWIIAAILLIAALLYLWRKGGKTGFSLRKLGERLKRLFRESGQDVPYVDEVEITRPWKSLTTQVKENVITRVRKARRKRIRLEDLPDDRMRIRYVYRELVRSPAGVKLNPAMTPTEVGAAYGSEPIRDLAEAYNIVRYAPATEVSRDAGSIAAAAMKELPTAARQASRNRGRMRDRPKSKSTGAEQIPVPGTIRDLGVLPSDPEATDADPATLAILPAAPVWLPFATVWENIRCAAKDRAAALRAAELVGLPKETLRKSPKTLTDEQKWLSVVARSLAAGAGRWEADLSALEPEAADRIGETLKRLARQERIEAFAPQRPCEPQEKRVCWFRKYREEGKPWN